MAFKCRTASSASRFKLASSRLDSIRGISFLGDPGANVGDVTASNSFPKIYFIDKEYKIVDRRLTVGPRRIILPKKKAAMVLEIPSGGIHLEVGTMVKIKI